MATISAMYRTINRPGRACAAPPNSPNSPNSPRGFSLIEVLVSIVILAFGMLGTVGMQTYALQANRDARQQAQAVMFANELAEMMRGNNKIAILPKASNPYMAVGAGTYCLSVASTAVCATTTEVAQAEMTDWRARVNAELPDAKVIVCFDSAPYDTTTGLANWACNDTGDIAYIKIGWTRSSTNTNRSDATVAAFEKAADSGSHPYVVVPVSGGSHT